MEKLEFKEVCIEIMNLLDEANKYYDEQKPWVQSKENVEGFNETIYTCSNIIANLANYINPFMPEISNKIRGYLNLDKANWEYIQVKPNLELKNIEPLFVRI
ncbi:MAG: class I tRNA ligase family protein [Clostridia bacterium]|nr:class I tRNA ligase family protein [Clostridia bacterium]